MLIVLVTVVHRSGRRTVLTGEIANVSDLRAVSAYEAWLDDRDGGRLAGYPRWSEPVRALVARCISLSRPRPAKAVAGRRPRTDSAQARIGWARLRVDIGLKPGGYGRVRRLAMVRLVRPEARPSGASSPLGAFTLAASDRADALSLGWIEGPLRGHREIAPRCHYPDAWSLAEHALTESVFLRDARTEPVALDIPVRQKGSSSSFILASDIPEPARSAFEWRQRHSGRPSHAWDAHHAWDWIDFLNGQR